MEATRRFWLLVTLGSASAILAILFGDILWLGIPLGIGLWLLIEQLAFTQLVAEVTATNPLTQSLSRETALVDDVVTLTIQLSPEAAPLTDYTATLTIPDHPALTFDGPREYDLTTVEQQISVSFTVGVAGTYSIKPPTVQVESPRGVFSETIQLGPSCTLTGEPRVPRDIHIGTGGERIAVAYGEHEADQGGSGFEPGELREYLPGDPTNRIDWKATARLGEPYVRDAQAETTRQTHVFIDQRPSMQTGPRGQTKLDYAREIAVLLTEYIADLDDPFGVTIVDDQQETISTRSDTGAAHYKRLHRELLNLGTAPQERQTTASSKTRSGTYQFTNSNVRRLAATLNGDDAFAQTLRPYVTSIDSYVGQVADQPLFQSVQTHLAEQAGASWLVIITDDTNRKELLETARAVTARETAVSFFLLPSVLFDSLEFTDLDTAAEDYRGFESFRQQLASIPRVTAFEVGPRARITSLIERSRNRGTTQT